MHFHRLVYFVIIDLIAIFRESHLQIPSIEVAGVVDVKKIENTFKQVTIIDELLNIDSGWNKLGVINLFIFVEINIVDYIFKFVLWNILSAKSFNKLVKFDITWIIEVESHKLVLEILNLRIF